MFPYRGAQDKIVSNLINIFHKECIKIGIPPECKTNNELKAIEVLNKLGRLNHD